MYAPALLWGKHFRTNITKVETRLDVQMGYCGAPSVLLFERPDSMLSLIAPEQLLYHTAYMYTDLSTERPNG